MEKIKHVHDYISLSLNQDFTAPYDGILTVNVPPLGEASTNFAIAYIDGKYIGNTVCVSAGYTSNSYNIKKGMVIRVSYGDPRFFPIY